jgi:hypothetical protein
MKLVTKHSSLQLLFKSKWDEYSLFKRVLFTLIYSTSLFIQNFLDRFIKPSNTKMVVFWVVAPCSLVEVYQRFRGACRVMSKHPDDGSKHLWNIGKLLPDYMAQQPRRQPSSYLPLWEPEVSLPAQNSPIFEIFTVYTSLNIIGIWFQERTSRCKNLT